MPANGRLDLTRRVKGYMDSKRTLQMPNTSLCYINLSEPCVLYIGRTATLHMLHFIFFFSTNVSTEYFKHAAHSPFFSSKCRLFHNATFFGSCIIHILHTECAKI